MAKQLPRRIIEGPSGKILELLRQGHRTVDELASFIGVTRPAVRAQLAILERDGLVERCGSRPGPSKPSHVYGMTSQAELLFSRAYVPILTQLLHVLAQRMPPGECDSVMHEVGRRLMEGRAVPRGPLVDRVAGASELLNELGALSEVQQENGGYLIHNHGCPLAAATANHPEVCNALESLLSEFVGSKVTKCCDRYDRARCCFEVSEEVPSGVELRH